MIHYNKCAERHHVTVIDTHLYVRSKCKSYQLDLECILLLVNLIYDGIAFDKIV